MKCTCVMAEEGERAKREERRDRREEMIAIIADFELAVVQPRMDGVP